MKQHKIPPPQTKFPFCRRENFVCPPSKKKFPSLIRRRFCSFIWYQCLRGAASRSTLIAPLIISQPHIPRLFFPVSKVWFLDYGVKIKMFGHSHDCDAHWSDSIFPVLEPDSGHLDTHLHWSLSLCCFTGMNNQIHWLQCMILARRPCTDVQSTIDLSRLEKPA